MALSSLGFVVLWGGEPEVVTVLVVSHFQEKAPSPCGSACCGLVCGSPCGSPMWGANFPHGLLEKSLTILCLFVRSDLALQGRILKIRALASLGKKSNEC